MKNLPFVIWMLGYPVTRTLSKYVTQHLLKREYSDTVLALAELVDLIIWLGIGFFLIEL